MPSEKRREYPRFSMASIIAHPCVPLGPPYSSFAILPVQRPERFAGAVVAGFLVHAESVPVAGALDLVGVHVVHADGDASLQEARMEARVM